MTRVCAGCGRAPATRSARRCTYCGGEFAGEAEPRAAAADKTEVAPAAMPFPEDPDPLGTFAAPGGLHPPPVAPPPPPSPSPGTPGRIPPPLPGAAPGAPAGERPRKSWAEVTEGAAPPGEAVPGAPPGAAPRARLSPEARAILEEKEAPGWLQTLYWPLASRTRRIVSGTLLFVLAGILFIVGFVDTYRPSTDEAPSRGGAAPPPPSAPRVPADVAAAQAALARLGEGLQAYAKEHSGFPETLSADLHELVLYGDYARALDDLKPGSLAYKHHLRLDVQHDSAEISAEPRGGGERVVLKLEWTQPVRPQGVFLPGDPSRRR